MFIGEYLRRTNPAVNLLNNACTCYTGDNRITKPIYFGVCIIFYRDKTDHEYDSKYFRMGES